MSKLHELLAVESSLETQALKCRSDLANTFEKKRHLFEEGITTFTANTGDAQPFEEAKSTLQSTVAKELGWLQPFIIKSLDASYQVAEANTLARADVLLDDGTVLLTGLPATALLELEKRIAEIHGLIGAIPTLDPAKGFVVDTQRGEDIFKAREIRTVRTKKAFVPLVLAAATKEHPAQVKEGFEDQPIGTIVKQEWSGLMTPADKADLLAKCEEVSRAVRSARSRANEQVVDSTKKIGAKLLGHIFG